MYLFSLPTYGSCFLLKEKGSRKLFVARVGALITVTLTTIFFFFCFFCFLDFEVCARAPTSTKDKNNCWILGIGCYLSINKLINYSLN